MGLYFRFVLRRNPITQQSAGRIIRDVDLIALVSTQDFDFGGGFGDEEGDVAGAGSPREDDDAAFGRGVGWAAPAQPGASPSGVGSGVAGAFDAPVHKRRAPRRFVV